MKRLGVLVIALALVSAGCGKFGSSDSKSASSSDTTAAGEVGAGLGVDTTRPYVTRPGVTTQPGAPQSRTTAPVDECKTKPTSSTAAYDNRIKMVLSVSRVCAAHADDIGLSLVVTNTSSEVIHYDTNQLTIFTIKAPIGEQKRRWEDDDCKTGTAEKRRAADLAPGASITLGTTYPAPKDVATRETCRRLETGGYDVQALFLVCDASYQDGYCDIAEDTQYKANPVNITLTS